MQEERGQVTQEGSEGRSCKRSEAKLTGGLVCRSPQDDLGRTGHNVCLLDLRSLILSIHLRRQKDKSTCSKDWPQQASQNWPTF
jgi:hypothetical protein